MVIRCSKVLLKGVHKIKLNMCQCYRMGAGLPNDINRLYIPYVVNYHYILMIYSDLKDNGVPNKILISWSKVIWNIIIAWRQNIQVPYWYRVIVF